PRELDKLNPHQAGSLAQKRLSRGCRLNHAESTVLTASVLVDVRSPSQQPRDDLDRLLELWGFMDATANCSLAPLDVS
ncbi:hypothetical protein BDK51DRAFT_23357, partial [Blyttiomyces helicus]